MPLEQHELDGLTRKIAEEVIRMIAQMGDGDDLDLGGDTLPDDLGGEQMDAGVGPGFTPGMAGGGDDEGVDEFDDLGDEGDAPPDDGEGDMDDPGDDLGDEPGDVDGGDEDEERYQADPMPGPGSRVRNDTRSTGKPMSTTQYQAGPADDGVALERYQAEDVDRVRYQQAVAQLGAARKADQKTIAVLKKQVERYASSHNELVAELNRRDRMDILKGLVAEGLDLDIEEELARTERYGHDDFDREVERIRVRYRRTSEGDEFVPTGVPLRGQEDGVTVDFPEMVRYSRTIESELPRQPEQRAAELARRYKAEKKAGKSF